MWFRSRIEYDNQKWRPFDAAATHSNSGKTLPMKRERGSTIERVLDILDTVAASHNPLSATEINEVLAPPRIDFAPSLKRVDTWLNASMEKATSLAIACST